MLTRCKNDSIIAPLLPLYGPTPEVLKIAPTMKKVIRFERSLQWTYDAPGPFCATCVCMQIHVLEYW